MRHHHHRQGLLGVLGLCCGWTIVLNLGSAFRGWSSPVSDTPAHTNDDDASHPPPKKIRHRNSNKNSNSNSSNITDSAVDLDVDDGNTKQNTTKKKKRKQKRSRSSSSSRSRPRLPEDDDDDDTLLQRERRIFYHIYVPPPPLPSPTAIPTTRGGALLWRWWTRPPPHPATEYAHRRQQALDIVDEQLDTYQRAVAGWPLAVTAASSNSTNSGTTTSREIPIYYTVIGDRTATHEIDALCRARQTPCRFLAPAHRTGDEGKTLQAVYEYCATAPATALVTYLHNKGSYHPSRENTALRRMLTTAIFSHQCQTISSSSESVTTDSTNTTSPRCNVCAGRFTPLPHTHMTGNMWVAECGYIQQLRPPDDFPTIMDRMLQVAQQQQQQPPSLWLFPTKPLPSTVWFAPRIPSDYGIGRYAYEHWIGSHPYLRPCDVYPNPQYTYGFLGLDLTLADDDPDTITTTTTTWEPTLQRIPWENGLLPLEKFWHYGFNDWFCGRAKLAQYNYLYGNTSTSTSSTSTSTTGSIKYPYSIIPDPDSFIWKYYAKPLVLPFKFSLYRLLDVRNVVWPRGCPDPIDRTEYSSTTTTSD